MNKPNVDYQKMSVEELIKIIEMQNEIIEKGEENLIKAKWIIENLERKK